MKEKEIVQKFVLVGKVPSRYTVQEVLGFSAQTLVRMGFVMSKIKEQYTEQTEIKKTCKLCGIFLENKNNTYCSHTCSAKANNSKRTRKSRLTSVRVNGSCIVAEVLIEDNKCICCNKTLPNRKSKYCSSTCQQKYQYDLFINAWLSGKDVKHALCKTVSARIRRYLFEKHNRKCSKCNWGEINPITQKVPLEVEHIDGNSENNSPENLTLLCPNCHSLTPTYKALNKGNGRHIRRQRYKDGKSY